MVHKNHALYNWKEKICTLCLNDYEPTSSTQKYCHCCSQIILSIDKRSRESRRDYAIAHGRIYYARTRDRQLAEKHSEHGRAKRRTDYHFGVKIAALNHYSNGSMKCARCGFSDLRALQIDHINGGGYREKKLYKLHGTSFYFWLRRNKFPEGYQVLCANCNWIKRFENLEGVLNIYTIDRYRDRYHEKEVTGSGVS